MLGERLHYVLVADRFRTLIIIATMAPQGSNWENGVSTFSRLFLIRTFYTFRPVKMSCIKSWTISKLSQIGPPTAELVALVHLNKSLLIYNGNNDVSTFSRLFMVKSFYICRYEEMHKRLGEFPGAISARSVN